MRQIDLRRSYFGTRSLIIFILLLGMAINSTSAIAQGNPQDGPSTEDNPTGAPSEPDEVGSNRSSNKKGISFFALLLRGGWFMIPLLILSLIVAAVAIERAIALRKEKIMPDELVTHLGNLGRLQGGFDPRSAYRICQQYPSSASTVVRALLLKVGRPQAEVETAASETSQREADRQHAPVSWLTLIATVAPLIGLLGTVWGITQAFFDMTNLEMGENKAETLATGIYTALVTTLCGLMIAIPAAILAHLFENRIVKMFAYIDELADSLMPQVEKYEGRLRFSDTVIEESPTTASLSSGSGRKRFKERATNPAAANPTAADQPTRELPGP
jgi:biopolymer transport protein ExbB